MQASRAPLKSILSTFIIALSAFASPLNALAEAIVGAPAPEFSAKDSTGKEVTLQGLRGKIVVLEWFNPGCPFVKKFYKNGDMQKMQQELQEKGVVWLTVSSSAPGKSGHLTPESAAETRSELKMKSSALLLDESGTIGKAYGARTTPHIFVISSDGKLAYAGAIDSEASTSSSDIAGATNYLVGAVDALRAGKQVAPSSTDAYGCSVKY
jgi:peroxiredoxin